MYISYIKKKEIWEILVKGNVIWYNIRWTVYNKSTAMFATWKVLVTDFLDLILTSLWKYCQCAFVCLFKLVWSSLTKSTPSPSLCVIAINSRMASLKFSLSAYKVADILWSPETLFDYEQKSLDVDVVSEDTFSFFSFINKITSL